MPASTQFPALLISSALCLAVGAAGTAQPGELPNQGANQVRFVVSPLTRANPSTIESTEQQREHHETIRLKAWRL
jgi:hypothetical protein